LEIETSFDHRITYSLNLSPLFIKISYQESKNTHGLLILYEEVHRKDVRLYRGRYVEINEDYLEVRVGREELDPDVQPVTEGDAEWVVSLNGHKTIVREQQ